MFHHLRIDIFERQETKLPVRLIKATNEQRLVLGHETTPLRVKGGIEDVSSEPDSGAESLPEPDEISNLIEEVVNLTRQINTEVDSDGIQEPLDFHNQKFDN
ncbi:hypothetical protein TNCV_1014281 [Trichonephila clavipes]|uniref:Uncharacterized protein n=1 Tax=Trichonephila clavipes TaxID=2585209 RepID=A0A8X6VXM8_TRICX|nr:hypothetical protein TNCV_1014281 [Trichonephila clavipes]